MDGTGKSYSDTPSLAVIKEIAEEEGIDPGEVEPPLGTVIDTDALNGLFTESGRTDGLVTFEYSGYRVMVDSDGDVELGPSVAGEPRVTGQGAGD